ncbi:DsbA family oxidoreductase [Myroides sp. LJL115]
MKIEIWSDLDCPFCYIGKKNLELAVNQLNFKNKIEIRYKGYQLDPTLPLEALTISNEQYLTQHKGYPAQQIKQMFAHVTQAAQQVGIKMNLDKCIPVNTLRAQRLIQLAQDHQLAPQMNDTLFKAYFTDGLNIGDLQVLKQLAMQIGLEEQEVTRVLESQEYLDQVNEDINQAKELQIQGVPFFVINRTYGISGAQPVESFLQALTQAYEEFTIGLNGSSTAQGNSCSIDGCD